MFDDDFSCVNSPQLHSCNSPSTLCCCAAAALTTIQDRATDSNNLKIIEIINIMLDQKEVIKDLHVIGRTYFSISGAQ